MPLKQVFLILLDNALKHSSGEIDVIIRCTAEEVKIQVQDHGEGIPPEIFGTYLRPILPR